MKKIFLFLLFSMLIVSVNAMVFTDVGHKETNKIEISKATPVLDLVANVQLEAIQINNAMDVGWQTYNLLEVNKTIKTDDLQVLKVPMLINAKQLYIQNSIQIYIDNYVSQYNCFKINPNKFVQLQTFSKPPNPVL